MGLRGEIADFVNTAMAVRKDIRADQDSEQKGKYYQAMIGVRQEANKIKAQQVSTSAALRAQGNKLKDDANKIHERDVARKEKYGDKNIELKERDTASKEGLRSARVKAIQDGKPSKPDKNAIELQPAPDDYNNPFGEGGAPAPASALPTNATPNSGTVPQRFAVPTSASNTEDDDNDTDKDTTNEPDNDEDDDAEDGYAEGGLVEAHNRQLPRAKTANEEVDSRYPVAGEISAGDVSNVKSARVRLQASAKGYAEGGEVKAEPEPKGRDEFGPTMSAEPEAPKKGAIPADAHGEADASKAPTKAEPEHDGIKEGGATRNGYGFDLAKALGSWGDDGTGSNAESLNPIALALKHMSAQPQPAQQPAPQTQAVPTPGQPAAPQPPQQGGTDGAATPEEVRALNKTVDPKGELSEAARTIARLDATVKFYAAKGDPDKAAKVAQSLVMYGKMVSQKFGALATVAIQNGDTDRAVKYLERAYDYIPDGQQIRAEVGKDGMVHAKLKDLQSGQEKDLGAFGPQQMLKLSLGVASGQEYMNQLQSVAHKGAEPKPAKAPAGDKGMTLRDRRGVEKDVAEGSDATGIDEKNVAAARDIATEIRGINKVSVGDAMVASRMMITPGQDPKAQRTEDGGAVIQMPDGRQFKVSKNAFLQAAAIRGEAEKAKASTDQAAAAKQKAGDDARAKRSAAGRERAQELEPNIQSPQAPGQIRDQYNSTPRYPVDKTNPSGMAIR